MIKCLLLKRVCCSPTKTMLWPWAVSVFGPALAAALVLSPPDGQLPLFAGNNPTGSILKRYPLSQLVGGRDSLDELHRATEVRAILLTRPLL